MVVFIFDELETFLENIGESILIAIKLSLFRGGHGEPLLEIGLLLGEIDNDLIIMYNNCILSVDGLSLEVDEIIQRVIFFLQDYYLVFYKRNLLDSLLILY